jgi:primosomal protein N' (replication factor Y)
MVSRQSRRWEFPVAVLHSGLGDGERLCAWLSARAGLVPVVIGTRSALFVPLPRLGLVVVDEEHDASYKQQEGLRYSARDMAVARARHEGIPVVLGSATPSLETVYNARRGRYLHVHLPERVGGGRQPRVGLVDLRRTPLRHGLSPPLLAAVAATIGRREQVLLFLNRRGYAPALICHACGWVANCLRCDAHLIFHRAAGLLRCHHCGAERPGVERCPACAAPDLRPVGSGTERLEDAIRDAFPEARIERIDRDTTRRKGSLEGVLERVSRGEAEILVGTQMLAKGHHFPRVTLAAVVDADGGLFSTDFRAPERMAQLITQVAGRAGRGDLPGEVLIQTHHPAHPFLRTLLQRGYAHFAQAALAEREAAGLPPLAYQALLRADSHRAGEALGFLRHARAAAAEPGVQLLGPVAAPMERRAGRYRAQLLLQARRRAPLHRLLDRWLPVIEGLPLVRQVRWSLDVDPVDFD